MVYTKKIVCVLFVVLAIFVLVVPISAASGSVNLKFASVTYKSRTEAGDKTFYITPEMRKWYELKDFDITDSFYWAFGLDTRILPDYTYHITYKIYTGEDYEDANFRTLVPSESINFYSGDDSSDIFTAYPTINVSATNTSTTVDIFMRFESGTDRGNQVAAGNYVTFGQSWDTSSLTPFEYEGIWVGLYSFQAVYDYDGEILDAMTAGFSDVKRGIDAVGNKIDEIGGKLDELKDDIKSGYDYEEQRANEESDERLSEGEDALGGVLDLSSFTRALQSLWGALSYEGFECEFVIPAVKLPQFDGFGGNVLIQQTSTDFGFWFQRPELQTPLLVVKFLMCFGAAWYLFRDVTTFMSSLFEGGSDE